MYITWEIFLSSNFPKYSNIITHKKLSNCFIYKYLDVMITIFNNTKKKEIHKKFFAASSFSGSQATRTRKISQKYLFINALSFAFQLS